MHHAPPPDLPAIGDRRTAFVQHAGVFDVLFAANRPCTFLGRRGMQVAQEDEGRRHGQERQGGDDDQVSVQPERRLHPARQKPAQAHREACHAQRQAQEEEARQHAFVRLADEHEPQQHVERDERARHDAARRLLAADPQAPEQQGDGDAQRRQRADVVDVGLAHPEHRQVHDHEGRHAQADERGQARLRVVQPGQKTIGFYDEATDERKRERPRRRAARLGEGLGQRGGRSKRLPHALGDVGAVPDAHQQHDQGNHQDDRQKPVREHARLRGEEERGDVHHVRKGDHHQREAWPIGHEHRHPAQDGQRPAHACGRLHDQLQRHGRHAKRPQHQIDRHGGDADQEQRLGPLDHLEVGKHGHDQKRRPVDGKAEQSELLAAVGTGIRVNEPSTLQKAESHDAQHHENGGFPVDKLLHCTALLHGLPRSQCVYYHTPACPSDSTPVGARARSLQVPSSHGRPKRSAFSRTATVSGDHASSAFLRSP